MTNPFEGASDNDLVRTAYDQGAPPGSVDVEMMRRLKDAIDRERKAADALGNKISRLNVWLLVFTVAIFLLTLVQVWPVLKSLWGGR